METYTEPQESFEGGFFETTSTFVQPDNKAQRGRRYTEEHSGRVPSNGKKYQIQHLWEKHHKMLRLTLLGWQLQDIATELGVTKATVMNCVNSSLGQKVLQEMQAVVDNKTIDVATKLQEMSFKAAEKLEELLDSENTPASLQARIAMDNLDRTGHARQINVKGNFLHGIITSDILEQIKKDAYSIVDTGELAHQRMLPQDGESTVEVIATTESTKSSNGDTYVNRVAIGEDGT